MNLSHTDRQHIRGLTLDSRAVKDGWLFAALPGTKADGRQFIADAVRNGAAVVLASSGTTLPDGIAPGSVELITDENPRRRFAMMAAEFYGAQPDTIAAVTGTNGKTSTVHFTRQLWAAEGRRAASLGTLGVCGPGVQKPGSMTTPDPAALHGELADLAAAGVTHLAMEASSHGLDQYRLDGVRVSAAGFTNITRDHLDYHRTMEDYLKAKSRLFSDVLSTDGTAVLNADVPEFETLKKISGRRQVISYGFAAPDLRIERVSPTPHGQDIALNIYGRRLEMTLPLVGQFQAMNALCALGLALAENNKADRAEELVRGLERISGAPGRLQLVRGHARGAAVYVDYAHTPDALENILKALRPHTHGRLVCVVGCGGDRDPGKRPIMGRIAVELADGVIVTDDNPRSEDPAKIRAAVLEGAKGAQEIGSRREAIRAAVRGLRDGDVLVIAGKGHEQGQIIAGRTEPFDDVEEAELAIKETEAA